MSDLPRSPRGKVSWSLTPEAFDRLLGALDVDRERAALAYEQLRDRITGLLHWWGAGDAANLADETLDRVARKLEEGAAVPKESLGAYFRGVARMVFYEASRRPRTEAQEADLPEVVPDQTDQAALDRLDVCLESLSGEDRSLVLRYYGDGKKADVRRALAEEVGISPTALRIRAHRLRERLERCVSGAQA